MLLGLVLTIPIDNYSYSTSGCVGLGTSKHEYKRYSLLKGEKIQFDQDKISIKPTAFEMIHAGCGTDTETHTLYTL